MSVKFILGRGGSGKSTYMLDKIQERVQDNETSPVILLLPEQYTFEMEKRISKLFSGDKKDKYLRARVLSFKTMGNIVFSNVGGLTDVNINSSGKAMITYRAIESASNDLEIFSKSASQSGFVSSISEMISELKQFNISEGYLVNNKNNKFKIEEKDNLMYIYNHEKIIKKDYKNYYYLPMEDLVIHKSMKSFVDTTSIIRADKNNCYSKFTPGDSFLSAKTDVTNYCADIIYYILSEK